MARKYKRKYKLTRPLKPTKYSNETYAAEFSLALDDATEGGRGVAYAEVIPKTTLLGTRKVKNFTIRMTCEPQSQTVGEAITHTRGLVIFALVYVPEGLNPVPPNLGTLLAPRSIYEPNQNVILSGIVDSNQTYTFKTRLARNLNSGDRICILFLDVNEAVIEHERTATPVIFTCNYAIAF